MPNLISRAYYEVYYNLHPHLKSLRGNHHRRFERWGVRIRRGPGQRTKKWHVAWVHAKTYTYIVSRSNSHLRLSSGEFSYKTTTHQRGKCIITANLRSSWSPVELLNCSAWMLFVCGSNFYHPHQKNIHSVLLAYNINHPKQHPPSDATAL